MMTEGIKFIVLGFVMINALKKLIPALVLPIVVNTLRI